MLAPYRDTRTRQTNGAINGKSAFEYEAKAGTVFQRGYGLPPRFVKRIARGQALARRFKAKDSTGFRLENA